ncbi:MAG: hypothetical protein COS89_06320 [Deltaproteobacteria bacterium CG07_land_8_20_14_0_80_38_7]|nr:MAG: hypothetical protein COS89_06320 [Deltaproteobacteria bacterium CG07_land_8_20_14_0_80_38_7]
MKHNKIFNILFFLLLLTAISSCGGSSGNLQSSDSSSSGVVSIAVNNSKSFNPNITPGQIKSYIVEITGPDIESPVTAEFDGNATEGRVDNVPAGKDREIFVYAKNPNNKIIRQGETSGVSIKGGSVTQTELTLEPVPIFTNLADKNTIDNTRFLFQVYSDPGSDLVVEEVTEESSSVMTDASTSNSSVNLDMSTGVGKLVPQVQPVGRHTYRIRDNNTGRHSDVEVNIVDGTKNKPASFYATGDSADPDIKKRLSSGTH